MNEWVNAIMGSIITIIFGGMCGIGYFWVLQLQYPMWNILSKVYISMFMAALSGFGLGYFVAYEGLCKDKV